MPSVLPTSDDSCDSPCTLPVFILDVGTRTIKSGMSTARVPRFTPSVTGTPKHKLCLPSSPSHDAHAAAPCGPDGAVVVGDDALRRRGLLHLAYPVQGGGVVADWPSFEPLLQRSIRDGITRPSTTGVASQPEINTDIIYSLVECPFASRPQRAQMIERLFEGAEATVPRAAGVCYNKSPNLTLYALGDTTGLVVEVGESGLRTAGIDYGFEVAACDRNETNGASGAAMTKYFTQLLYQSGVLGPGAMAAQRQTPPTAVAPTAGSPESVWGWAGAGSAQERETVYAIKERCCIVSETKRTIVRGDTYDIPSSSTTRPDRTTAVELPDGQIIRVGQMEALQAAEVLFVPSLMGLEGPGVVDVVLDAIDALPDDVVEPLMKNVVLTGGCSCLPGFAKRAYTEIESYVREANEWHGRRVPRLSVRAPKDRLYTGWLGASIVAKLPTFMANVVTRAQYEEEGDSVIRKKAWF